MAFVAANTWVKLFNGFIKVSMVIRVKPNECQFALRRHLFTPNHMKEGALHKVKVIENNLTMGRREQIKTIVREN